MLQTTLNSLSTLPGFLGYFACSVLLVAAFVALYVRITPYREITLIREGNIAAAVALSGSILGYIIPLASAVSHSVNLLDMLVWGIVGMVVQLLAFLCARTVLPNIRTDIPAGRIAPATLLSVFSVGAGVLNAAAMTY